MIQIDPAQQGAPLKQPWKNLITIGRAAELLRADLRAHVRQGQQQIGWRACRFHGLFHDEMRVVSRRPDGSLAFSWTYVDQIFDFLLSVGLKPFVQLGAMPGELASGEQVIFHWAMNVTPPKQWEEWEQLAEALGRHCIERYGIEEVRSWHFEVWNEPNLQGFWTGSQEDYFQLYRSAVLGLKRADDQLRVGGPATSSASWIPEFIDFCHKSETPVDFVSTHLYPQDEYVQFHSQDRSPHAPGMFFADTIKRVQEQVTTSPLPDLAIHWTEWNTQSATSSDNISWLENPAVDSCFAASFIVRNLPRIDTACDSFGWWVLSDVFEEAGMPTAPFSHTYGLYTIHGLPKASANAFRFLNRMRGSVIATEEPEGAPDRGLLATREQDTLRILLWNHHPVQDWDKEATWKETLCLPRPAPESRYSVFIESITPEHGSAYEAFRAIGSPENPDPEELALLKQASEPIVEMRQHNDTAETIEVPLELPPHGVTLVTLKPTPLRAAGKGNRKESSESQDLEAKFSGE